jgi:hypothetical protein
VEEAGRRGGDLDRRVAEQRKGRGREIEESANRWGLRVSVREEKKREGRESGPPAGREDAGSG